jgi:hypothetical protein
VLDLILLYYLSPQSQLYVSRIGFDAVLQCATSSVELSLTDSLQQTSSNILHMYSAETNNGGSSNYLKLEIDEHVVAAMIKILTLKIVSDSVLKEYMKYVQSVHIDSLVQGEYRKFVTSRSRAIEASSTSSSSTGGTVRDAILSDTMSGQSQTPLSTSTSSSTVPSDGLCEGGMSDKEQQTLLFLSRCKVIASKHVNDMKSNLLSTFSGQEAMVWTQGRSRYRAEYSRAEHTQSSLQGSTQGSIGPDSGSGSSSISNGPSLQDNSGESSALQPIAPEEGTSGASRCQRKRSIGDI